MREAMFFGSIIVLSILIGIMSNELGVTQSDQLCDDPFNQEPCVNPPDDPGEGSLFDQIMAPFRYIWDAVAAFFKIITFQVDGVPPLVSIMMLTPVSIATVWLILRLIRGGG